MEQQSLNAWISGTKVLNPDGTPMVCYHATYAAFDTFIELSHFGTALAAKNRIADRTSYRKDISGARTIPVFLRITNPLRVTDQEASDEANFLRSIVNGKYPDLDRVIARRDGQVAVLTAAGYDGMVYKNQFEDHGNDSWVVLGNSQVRGIFDL